jgi:hypothetical protein
MPEKLVPAHAQSISEGEVGFKQYQELEIIKKWEK